jgi:hypothetical protein
MCVKEALQLGHVIQIMVGQDSMGWGSGDEEVVEREKYEFENMSLGIHA